MQQKRPTTTQPGLARSHSEKQVPPETLEKFKQFRCAVTAVGSTREKKSIVQTFSIKSMQNLTNNEPIEVTPTSVNFKDIEQNQVYETIVYVQNLSKQSQRIKIIQPETQRFRVDFNAQGAIAAGLSLKLIITFEAQIAENYSDKIVVQYEKLGKKAEISVPLYAYKPQAEILFEPFVNMGFVKMHQDNSDLIKFKNEGCVAGKVRLLTDHLPTVRCEPSEFVIQPQAQYEVKVIYNPREAGLFRGCIDVVTEGSSLLKTIDVNATSVEFNKFVIDQTGTQTSMFEFGEMYIGQTKKINGFIVNNTPKSYKYRIVLRLGYYSSNVNNILLDLMIDSDLGTKANPANSAGARSGADRVNSFLQPEERKNRALQSGKHNYMCCSKVTYKHQVEVAQLAYKEDMRGADPEDFTYSALVIFEGEEDLPTIVSLTGKGVIPLIKITRQYLQFGTCPQNEHREALFEIENVHKELSLDVAVSRIPCFFATPGELRLQPLMSASVVATFHPTNIGHYAQSLNVCLLQNKYQIPLKVYGVCTELGPKGSLTRGPESLPRDFMLPPNFNEDFLQTINKKSMLGGDQSSSCAQIENQLPKGIIAGELNMEKLEEMKLKHENREKYIQCLRQRKESRLIKEKEKILKLRVDQLEAKFKEQGLQLYQEEEEDQNFAPRDKEFEARLLDTNIRPPTMGLPEMRDQLFVTKPIGSYEPHIEEATKMFHPDPLAPVRKYFPTQPLTHKEIRDIALELSGEQLQKVLVGPVKMDFGEVYVKSRKTMTFHVKNDLRNSIMVRLSVSAEAPELSMTYQQPQIVPSSDTAKFDVSVQSYVLDDNFQRTIKYAINERHTFEIRVTAKIIPVRLQLSFSELKFQFSEDNSNMETYESLKISNRGNAPGKFRWEFPENKTFVVDPREGVVPPEGSVQVTFTYRPSPSLKENIAGGQRIEDEKLQMKVEDGPTQTVKCIGIVNEAKCQLKQVALDLKEIIVCKEETRSFSIKNMSRIPAIYRVIQENLPECCDVQPLQGKIAPDGMQDLILKYACNEEREVKNEIQIMVRGGKILKLDFTVKSIIPKVEIKEEAFDFGKITTLGNSGTLEMTLVNTSAIPAELILDMRAENENPDCPDGIECLAVTPGTDMDESVLKSVQQDLPGENQEQQQSTLKPVAASKKQSQNNNDEDLDALGDVSANDSDESEMAQTSQKLYTLTIKGGQVLKFMLRFSPKDVKPYSFELPLTLARYGRLAGLTRTVTCRGMKPRFLVEPQRIEFPRKIITTADKCVPTTMEVTLSNPEKKAIEWRIHAQDLESDNVFAIHPVEGRVDPGQTLRIKASFNPLAPGSYSHSIPLFIDEQKESCLDLAFTGMAAFPKLLFDRREILLPVVPLDVEAKCVFRIINDGYENLTLKYRVLEENNFRITCRFPEGKSIGITKTKVRVEACFVSPKPTSFTTKIEFTDENQNSYLIPISGTADNCVLTNYPYLLRCQDEYSIQLDPENGTIQLIDEESKRQLAASTTTAAQQQQQQSGAGGASGENTAPNNNPDNTSDVASNSTRRNPLKGGQNKQLQNVHNSHSYYGKSPASSHSSSRQAIGYSPIPREQVEYTRVQIKLWLNQYVLSNHIQSFPDSIVEEDGAQAFELLAFVIGRSNFPYKATIDHAGKRTDIALALFRQYDEMIRILKIDGAMLCHIRPQYLLAFNDYHAYIKSLPAEELQFVHPNSLRMTPSRFQYFHVDSWCTLFYQILRVYYLSRINIKILKTIPNVAYAASQQAQQSTQQQLQNQTLPDAYNSGSNIYGQLEGVLLRWMELNYESANPGKNLRLLNFDKDLQSGLVFASLIQNYVGAHTTQELFVGMKQQCTNEDEVQANCHKLSLALQEIRLFTIYTSADFAKPGQKEMLLFTIDLYNSLPHYIPKNQQIVFKCILGETITKTVELSNPSSKPISYWVKQNGSTDYQTECECFKIEPRSSKSYQIKFVSRVSQPQKGRITFTNKKESNVQAAALVFDLISEIHGRISKYTHPVEAKLYETRDFTIPVNNDFTQSTYEFGDFQVQLIHEYELRKQQEQQEKLLQQQLQQKQQKAGQIQQKKKTKKELEEEEARRLAAEQEVFIPSFFLKQQDQKIRIKRNSTFHMQMAFIPMVFQTQRCYLIFSDPKVGEFQYEVIGRVGMPELVEEIPKQPIQPPIYVDEQKVWLMALEFKNEGIKTARKNVEYYLFERTRNRAALEVAGGATGTTAAEVTGSGTISGAGTVNNQPSTNQAKQKYQFPPFPDLINFDVEIEQPPAAAVNIPKAITISNPVKKKRDAGDQKDNKSKLDSSFESKKAETSQMFSNALLLDREGGQTGVQNVLPFNFNFKAPYQHYKCLITLKSLDLTDVRIFKLDVSAMPKPVHAHIEMSCPAREVIVQEIPIFNPSERDWVIRVQLTLKSDNDGDASSAADELAFTVPSVISTQQQQQNSNSTNSSSTVLSVDHHQLYLYGGAALPATIKDLTVKKKSTTILPLVFAPRWIRDCTAILLLKNTVTFDEFEYELRGVGEEPLAIDHLIISCQAHTTTRKEILLRNPYKDRAITLGVETDLIGASGEPSVTINAGKKFNYIMNITPIMSGQYTGEITFTNQQTGEYFWWTALLNTESPPPNQVIELATNLRKAVAFDIDLRNPFNHESVTFEVLMDGEGLIGESSFTLAPGQQNIYELVFQPLKTGRQKGSIAFLHERLGEIWYELILNATESEEIRLPMLKAELGKVEFHEIVLENPSEKPASVITKVTNPANFDVIPETITIPPFDIQTVHIRYMPSILDATQSSQILFLTQEIGSWSYLAFGMGTPPTKFTPKTVTVGLNKDFSDVILFKNPFKDSIQVRIFLDAPDPASRQVIKLLLKANSIKSSGGASGGQQHVVEELCTNISGLSVIQIPFSFTPMEIRCYAADVVIAMNEKIQWRYPINAVTESFANGILQFFKTKSRVLSESEFSISLPGFSKPLYQQQSNPVVNSASDNNNDTFTFELRNVPEDCRALIEKCFKLDMKNNKLKGPDDKLNFSVWFLPYKPFKAIVELVILRKIGGLWKYKLSIEATPPNLDDVIILNSPLHFTASVQFRLTNRSKTFATFTSKFTHDSDPEFSILPKTGLLEPYGRDGTQFTISFTPVEYGKTRSGKLIIETEDMFWSYNVKGILPIYEVPKAFESKLNNKLDEQIEERIAHQQSKNFLAANIKQTKDKKRTNNLTINNNESRNETLAGGKSVLGRSMMSNNPKSVIKSIKSKND